MTHQIYYHNIYYELNMPYNLDITKIYHRTKETE